MTHYWILWIILEYENASVFNIYGFDGIYGLFVVFELKLKKKCKVY